MNFASAYITFELNDGSILMAGEMEVPTVYNSREELILWRLDANGNVLWVQTDSCSIWVPNNGHLNVTGMTQDPAGNIYLCGNFAIRFSDPKREVLYRKWIPPGNIVWDRYFSYCSRRVMAFFGSENEISVYGVNPFMCMHRMEAELQTNRLWNIRINPPPGDTFAQKAGIRISAPIPAGIVYQRVWVCWQLTNGNIGISGNG